MKKMLLVGAAITIVAVIFLSKVSNKKSVNDLILDNIEALAAGESSGNYTCYGSGSVKCPTDGRGVAYVREPFSLE